MNVRVSPPTAVTATSIVEWLCTERVQRLCVLALLAAAACYLYLPFLNNPFMFDDANIFFKKILAEAAIAPWELGTRGLPLFTLGWVQTQIGTMSAQRSVSLALHIAVAYQLYRFLEAVLRARSEPATPVEASAQIRWTAALLALVFACHPVAVYGAGYLVQRNIVMATLFTLLGLRSLLDAMQRNLIGRSVDAAFWTSLAIMCKEHAVMVPMAALGLALIVNSPVSIRVRQGSIFFALSLPAMVFAAYTSYYAVGYAYEPGIKEIESELYGLPKFSDMHEKWLLSASIQAQLFWDYWRQWLLPDTRHMSIDLRVDFLQPWTHLGAFSWIVGTVMLPLLAVRPLLRWVSGRLVAFAILYTMLLFATEVVTIRFQEPYVLYRSYLWSVGYFVFLAALLRLLPFKVSSTLLVLAIPLLLVQATGRLETFQTGRALWEDAGAKLPKAEIGGSSRIFFNRGRERFGAGKIDDAMNDINLAIRLNPANGQYRIARAVTWMRQGQYDTALADLEFARQSLPDDGRLLFLRFVVLRALGRMEEAEASLQAAARNGSLGAKSEIARRRSAGSSSPVDTGQQR